MTREATPSQPAIQLGVTLLPYSSLSTVGRDADNTAKIILLIPVSLPCLLVEPELHNIPTDSELIHTLVEEDNVTFECMASAIPVPKIIWVANNHLVQATLNVRMQQDEEVFRGVYQRPDVPDAIRSRLTVTMLRERDSGDYVCRADIGLGQPAVLPQPFSLNVTESKDALSMVLPALLVSFWFFIPQSL